MPAKPTPKKQPKKPARQRKTVHKKPTPAAETLSFRPRKMEDDDYIVALTESQLSSIHQQAFGEPFPREQFRNYLQSGAPTVVVEKGKNRIGYYSYLVSPDGKMHISAMVIDPTYQSDGVGSKVMRHLEDEAKKIGVQTLEVFVQTGNEKSLAFTRKLGFMEAYYVTPTTICFQKTVGVVSQGQQSTQVPQGNPEMAPPRFSQQF